MSSDDANADLVLQPEGKEEPPAARTERVKKAHDYTHYVQIYGKQVRTIKWWVQQGRDAPGGPDLPPLDNPVEMPVWWRRVMKQRCPESVELAARQACEPGVASSKQETAPMVASIMRSAPLQVGPVTTQEENLQQLREQLARCRSELLELQNAPEPELAKIEAKERKWRELRAEVDEAEEAVFKMRAKQGKLVDVDIVSAELQPMLVTIASAFRGVVTKMKAKLGTLATDEERDIAWNAAVDECFSELIVSGFVTREQLALAA